MTKVLNNDKSINGSMDSINIPCFKPINGLDGLGIQWLQVMENHYPKPGNCQLLIIYRVWS